MSRARLAIARFDPLLAVTLSVVIVSACIVRVWWLLRWEQSYQSDEAVVGLLARHIVQGEWSTYFYGQRYLGSLDSTLSAVSLWLLGDSVPALRAPQAVLFLAFAVVMVLLVRELFGWRTGFVVLKDPT